MVSDLTENVTLFAVWEDVGPVTNVYIYADWLYDIDEYRNGRDNYKLELIRIAQDAAYSFEKTFSDAFFEMKMFFHSSPNNCRVKHNPMFSFSKCLFVS